MILRTSSRRDCWEGPVATLVFSSPVLRGRVSVAPLWSCLFHLTAGVCGLSTDMLHGDILRRLKLHGQNHTKCTQFGPCKKIVFHRLCFLKTEY